MANSTLDIRTHKARAAAAAKGKGRGATKVPFLPSSLRPPPLKLFPPSSLPPPPLLLSPSFPYFLPPFPTKINERGGGGRGGGAQSRFFLLPFLPSLLPPSRDLFHPFLSLPKKRDMRLRMLFCQLDFIKAVKKIVL